MPPHGRARIGTSGWAYPGWRGDFYPQGLPQRRELAYLAEQLSTVEVNSTFYSLTRPTACAAWRAAVPAGFSFAIKGSRFITHMLKLRNFETALANFFASGLLRLGQTLGPILWQLPPQLPYDQDRARAFFEAVPRDVRAAERWARRHDARTTGRAALRAPAGAAANLRHAVEIRHPSWLTDRALETLRSLDVALVASDTAGKYPQSHERTAGFAYVRLHGSTRLYASRYSDAEIAAWARRIGAWTDAGSDVHVYFDNDAEGHAPHDAVRLQRAVTSWARS
ncbi:MAG TPA: DUF72 domain-containing protein [Polyangia bacterium]|nr:DUF72 domain-containing protein [Polyangia bacterium]